MYPRLPALALLLAACSSSPATPDSRAADLVPGEALADRATADLRRDLAPDHPRPPARWETVTGASLTLIDHTVTALANGDVLIVGGKTDDGTGTGQYLYQKKAYRFVADKGRLEDAGELNEARAQHRAVLLADGRVLVLGGDNANIYGLSTVEIFDPNKPAASAWSTGAAMPSAVRGFDALRLANGDVMISGGTVDGTSSQTGVYFHKADGTWRITLATLKESRRHHASVLLASGKVLVSGGLTGPDKLGTGTYRASMEVYDPASGGFTMLSTPVAPRAYHLMRLVGGQVLVVGGRCGMNCPVLAHELYDPAFETLTSISSPGATSSIEAAIPLPDGRLIILAAQQNLAFLGLGPTGGWELLPTMPTQRYAFGAALLKDGSVLVAGGLIDGAKITHAEPLERLFP